MQNLPKIDTKKIGHTPDRPRPSHKTTVPQKNNLNIPITKTLQAVIYFNQIAVLSFRLNCLRDSEHEAKIPQLEEIGHTPDKPRPIHKKTVQQKNNLNIPCTKTFQAVMYFERKSVLSLRKNLLPDSEDEATKQNSKKSHRHLTDRDPLTRKLSNRKIIWIFRSRNSSSSYVFGS